jgi:hypothetical protein
MRAGGGDKTFERRAGRVLSALEGGGALRQEVGEVGAPPRYEIAVAGERAPRLVAEAAVIDEMVARDWLSRDREGGIGATAAGLAWLKRRARPDTPFRAQHLALSPADSRGPAPEAAAVVDNESPLAWLRRRRDPAGRPMISQAQYDAGERLRADFTRARLSPRVTADWSATPERRRRRGGPTGVHLVESALAARQRVEAAVAAVGPALGGVLLDVCGFLAGLEEVERQRGWPRRSGKVVLAIALDRLAAHYGFAETARGPDSARIRQWGATDYRPRL